MSAKPHFLQPLLKKGHPEFVLRNTRTESVVATQLELTIDSESRRRGLLGRTGLAENAAMIIAPSNAVHTFFMQFTIDVVFADRQGKVVKLCRHLKPWRIGVGMRAFAAIELVGGSIDRCGITTGDRLVLTQDPPV